MNKLIYFFLAVFIILSFNLFAESIDGDYRYFFGTSIGFLSGKTEEIVYIDGVSGDKLSQLDWEFKNVLLAGFDLVFDWQSNKSAFGFFYKFDFKFGITGFPFTNGVMEDRDWVDTSGKGEYYTYPDWLNLYSEHENKTNAVFLADFSAGVKVRLKSASILKVFLSYNFMNYYWEAFGGSHLYPPETLDRHGYWPSSQKVITYSQSWHMLSPGVSYYGEFNSLFNIELFFKCSPFIWLSSIDNHIGKNTVYIDKPKGGLFLEPGLVFSFNSGKNTSLSFTYSYKKITGSRGESGYSKNGNPVVEIGNMAGAAFTSHEVGLLLKFRLL